MKILLLTRNHVVREFVELVADRVDAELVLYDTVEGIVDVGYDFLFVDDRGELLEQSKALIERLETRKNIVLYNQAKAIHDLFDIQVKKPFLPSDIQMILEAPPETEVHLEEDQILNIRDIDEIKSLLEDEGLEIVSEEDLADEITAESGIQIVESQISQEDKLIEAIMQMEPKRIRKLLKGAEVTIKIRFPKGNE
jgi:hypothetical protein